jgi:type VI secretion system protein
MREERLLERIRSREEDPTRRSGDDPGRITESVLQHLQRILNTWQGNVPIAEDFGVPDLMNFMHSIPDSARDVERAIRTVIQKYEPRLKSVRVSFVPREEGDDLTLHFQIDAKLGSDPRSHVHFKTFIDTDGKVDVKR